jgi:uncharacterized protein (DUF342 family)
MAEASKDGAPSGESAKAPGATTAPTPPVGSATPTPPVGSPGDYLEIKAEPQRATLTIKSAVALAGVTITRDDVAKKLQGLAVINGVDWAAVDRMIAGKQYDRGQIVAQGIPAKPSRDAVIQEKIKIDSDLKPVVKKDGKADYKNVDNIHQVKKGDVLAVKVPAVQGEEGKDIFGKPLPAQPAKDAQFKLGANTTVSADGLELQALVSGYVYHQAGAICVGVTYVLKGDVDFHTGNLHYLGDIQVLGNVTDGFTVEAEGNIVIEGTVEGAEVVSHNAGVHVKSGIFGHGKGRIAAKTHVHVQSAQDVTLECDTGTVEVDKGLRNCHVIAQNLKADKAGCSVVGGEIKAYGEVAIGVLGGEGCHTHIRVLDKEAEAAKVRLKEIERLKAELGPKLEPLEKKLVNMKAMIAKYGTTMTERAKADFKLVVDAYTAIKKSEKEFEEEKAKMNAVMARPPTHVGKFAVMEKIVWGGVVELYGHIRELEAEDAKKEWLWAPGGVISRSLIPEPEKKDPETPAPGAAPPS